MSEIKLREGSTVQINTVVAVIGGSALGSAVSTTAAVPASAKPASTPSISAASQPVAASAGTNEKLRSSPLVRRIAKDNNLDLRQISGTGSGGRITKDDALKFLAENGAGASAPIA